MGFIYSLLVTFFLAFGASEVPYASVEKAFDAGNSSSLSALGKEKTLINVLGNEGVYSKSQATLVLKEFFSKNPPGDFSYVHKGKGSSEGSFAIGKYISKSNEFRVTVHFKKMSSDFRIESLSIEK